MQSCSDTKQGYVTGFKCGCGGFNHSLFSGAMFCLFCGKERAFIILEGVVNYGSTDVKEQGGSG